MADDSASTVTGATLTTPTYNATADGGGNKTLQSSPRVRGAIVSDTNPMPVNGTVTVTGLSLSSTVTLAAGSNAIGSVIANATDTAVSTALGAPADAAYTSGSGSLISIAKGFFGRLASLGQKTMTGSMPVVLASDQSTIPMNIGQVAGATVLTGAGVASGALRVAFPTDQAMNGTITGTVAISGTPAITGTVAATQSGTFTVQPGNTQNTTAWLTDINGGVVNALQGFTTSTGTTAATVIAAQGSGVSIFVGSLQIGNTSTTQSTVTLNDSASTQLIVPANGGTNPTFQPPLKVAANTALTVTPAVAVTTMLIGAQGHKG